MSERPRERNHPNPVAIVDIGSNSVRLVVYEALTPFAVRDLQREIALRAGQRRCDDGAIAAGAGSTRRWLHCAASRTLCTLMEVSDVHVLATGGRARRQQWTRIPGRRRRRHRPQGQPAVPAHARAELSALGVMSAVHAPDGVVGDLGGGSLELIEIGEGRIGAGASLPLGGLALTDASGRSPRQASRIAREALARTKVLEKLRGRTFYAVGGTWRALAKLHMSQRNYPIPGMHGYVMPAREAADFAGLIERVDTDTLVSIDTVSTLAPAAPALWRRRARRGDPARPAEGHRHLDGGRARGADLRGARCREPQA